MNGRDGRGGTHSGRGRPVAIAAAAFVLTAAAARAQGDDGFLRGRGKLDAAVSYTAERFDRFWVGDQKGKNPAVGEITRESTSLWVAWGLADELDLVATAAFVDAENDGTANVSDESDLQDATLGVKWRLHERRLGPGALSFLAAPAVKIPLTNYENDTITAIGDGQIDYRGRAIVHYRFDDGAFAALESGFDYRTQGTPNQVPVNLKIGFTFADRVTVTPFYERLDSLGGGDIGQVPFPDVQEDYERWGVSLYARLTPKYGVTVGWKDTLDGKNTGDLTGWFGGVVVRF